MPGYRPRNRPRLHSETEAQYYHSKLGYETVGLKPVTMYNCANPSRVVIPNVWHQWQPVLSCHSQNLASAATRPELSFPKSGIGGNPSRDVIPKIWHRWQPVPIGHSQNLASVATRPKWSFPKSGIGGIQSQVVIPKSRATFASQY
eukprot:6463098-Amphidinium_carterae.1